LLVAGSLIALVVGALCEMYLVGQKLTRRVGAEATAWQMANLGMERMAAIIEQAVKFEVRDGGTVLKVVMPRLTDSEGNYVPKADKDRLKYEDGEEDRLYLADSSGVNDGDILWLRRKPRGGDDLPDPEWSLNPGMTTGRVQPVSSLDFVKVNDLAVRATITVTQSYSGKTATATLTRMIYPRNHN
jgi:hypothetical protein